jgi:hypothetical protein
VTGRIAANVPEKSDAVVATAIKRTTPIGAAIQKPARRSASVISRRCTSASASGPATSSSPNAIIVIAKA